MYKLVSFISVLIVAIVSADIPASLTKCHKRDNDCFLKTTQDILKNHYVGWKELNLLPLDPFHVKSIVLERNPSSPVNIQLMFEDIIMTGFKDANLKQVKGLTFEEHSVFEGVIPKLTLKSNYHIDGKVLILPITGKGQSVITCKDLHLKYTFSMKKVDIKGKVHAEIEKGNLEINPGHINYYFENLFNGDKALGDTMNNFLNENSVEVYKELKPSLSTAFSLILNNIANHVLRSIPYDEAFL